MTDFYVFTDGKGNFFKKAAVVQPDGSFADLVVMDALPAGDKLIGKVASDTVATATLSNVAASASSVTILAANTARKRVVIHNDSTATLLLKFGATASATSFTHKLLGGASYESPSNPIYTGRIDGIWSSATGSARVTEFTA
jgi:hypothetical protein